MYHEVARQEYGKNACSRAEYISAIRNFSWRKMAPAMAVRLGPRNVITVASDNERY
jgi:hypothetical protein